jgi:hypothetical protein
VTKESVLILRLQIVQFSHCEVIFHRFWQSISERDFNDLIVFCNSMNELVNLMLTDSGAPPILSNESEPGFEFSEIFFINLVGGSVADSSSFLGSEFCKLCP